MPAASPRRSNAPTAPRRRQRRRRARAPNKDTTWSRLVPEREREQRQHADEREPRQRTPPTLPPRGARHEIADREQLERKRHQDHEDVRQPNQPAGPPGLRQRLGDDNIHTPSKGQRARDAKQTIEESDGRRSPNNHILQRPPVRARRRVADGDDDRRGPLKSEDRRARKVKTLPGDPTPCSSRAPGPPGPTVPAPRQK